MPLDAYMYLMIAVHRLPASVQHVVMVITVPVVYPHLTGSEHVLKMFRAADRLRPIHWLFDKTGAALLHGSSRCTGVVAAACPQSAALHALLLLAACRLRLPPPPLALPRPPTLPARCPLQASARSS